MKIESLSNIGGNVLFDLGERTMATEAILFIHAHLKYAQNRVSVSQPINVFIRVLENHYRS